MKPKSEFIFYLVLVCILWTSRGVHKQQLSLNGTLIEVCEGLAPQTSVVSWLQSNSKPCGGSELAIISGNVLSSVLNNARNILVVANLCNAYWTNII